MHLNKPIWVAQGRTLTDEDSLRYGSPFWYEHYCAGPIRVGAATAADIAALKRDVARSCLYLTFDDEEHAEFNRDCERASVGFLCELNMDGRADQYKRDRRKTFSQRTRVSGTSRYQFRAAARRKSMKLTFLGGRKKPDYSRVDM